MSARVWNDVRMNGSRTCSQQLPCARAGLTKRLRFQENERRWWKIGLMNSKLMALYNIISERTVSWLSTAEFLSGSIKKIVNSTGRHKLGALLNSWTELLMLKKKKCFPMNGTNCTNLLERNHLETHHKAASAVITQEPASITVPEAQRCAPYTGISDIPICLDMWATNTEGLLFTQWLNQTGSVSWNKASHNECKESAG